MAQKSSHTVIHAFTELSSVCQKCKALHCKMKPNILEDDTILHFIQCYIGAGIFLNWTSK